MRTLFTLILLAILASGCAMSRSHFETADGDKANKMAISTIGKQEVQQKTDFHVMPNNSGLDLVDGAISNQDTTEVIPLVQALVSAFTQAQTGNTQTPTASSPSALERIQQLSAQVEALRTLVDSLRK